MKIRNFILTTLALLVLAGAAAWLYLHYAGRAGETRYLALDVVDEHIWRRGTDDGDLRRFAIVLHPRREPSAVPVKTRAQSWK